MNTYKIREVCTIPWGEELKEEFTLLPETSLYNPNKVYKDQARKNILFRVSNETCLVFSGQALTADQHPELSFLKINNKKISKNKIIITRNLQHYRLVDFAITEEERIVVLVENGDRQQFAYFLVTVESDGRCIETEIQIPAEQAYFDIRKIRVDKEDIYFEVKLSAGRGLYATSDDGVLQSVYENRLALGLFIADNQHIIAALSNAGFSENYWALIDIATKKELIKLSNPLYNAHNALPFFATPNKNVYGSKGFEIVRQNLVSGDIKTIDLRNFVPLPDNEFFLCKTMNENAIELVRTHHQETDGGDYLTLKLPGDLGEIVYANLQNVDSNGNFYIRVKTKDTTDVLLTFSQVGAFTGKTSAGDTVDSNLLQNPDTWQVDENDKLYLPVLRNTGLAIFEITIS
ncbi:MAG: hypothetical protein JWP81_1800 [Ferruginibacter sp.]|nr:hypothetical protein [Ferruginibacter sp.]